MLTRYQVTKRFTKHIIVHENSNSKLNSSRVNFNDEDFEKNRTAVSFVENKRSKTNFFLTIDLLRMCVELRSKDFQRSCANRRGLSEKDI